jgi:two-component system sensor histidine kinase TctE
MTKDGLSLKKQLLLWLLVPQLLLWLAGAILSNAVAIHYANTVIDNDLAQLANMLLRHVSHETPNSMQDLPDSTKAFLTDNPDDRIYYVIGLPEQPPLISNINHIPYCSKKVQVLDKPLYCSGMIAQQPVRVLTILLPYPNRPHLHLQVRVAKNLVLRSQLTREILLATVIPLSILMVIISLAVWWGISRGLKPLYQLQQSVKNRAIHDLNPIEIANAPTEIHALTDELNALLQAINDSIDKQRRFIADAAHQLRTPLAGLKSQTELAMRETNLENLQARLKLVHSSSIRSIHLINQLLTLARSEPGQQDIMPKVDVDLAKLIREITSESVPRALAANIDLGCDSSLTSAAIKANSALLRELFLNLIENAIKYAASGSTVTIRLLSEGLYYVVEVEDNGPGIPNADKTRVFERFYRGTQTGNGCGLGLAIVKEIALRHHGNIELRDAKPQGLIVRVLLPKPDSP